MRTVPDRDRGPPIALRTGMFFHSWSDVGRAATVTALVFIVVVALHRVVGQQALAKMSGYDVIASVTIGSVIATVAITRSITVSDAMAALITLLALQELMRWLQSRSLMVHRMVRGHHASCSGTVCYPNTDRRRAA